MEGVKELGRFTLRGRTFIVYEKRVVSCTTRQTNKDLQLFLDDEFVTAYTKETNRVRGAG